MALNTGQAKIEITAVDKTRQAFDSLKSSFANLARQYAGLGTLLSGGAFATLIRNAIDAADAMNDLSKRTGISVERLGAWKLATEQSGTSLEALAVALGRGSKYMVAHGDNLKKLGINAKTAEELVIQLSGVISRLPADDPRRVALAMEVLGRSAVDLLPLLAEGEEGLRRMLERGREINPITQEMADKADKFNDQLAELKIQAGGVAFLIAGPLLDGFTTLIGRIQQITKETNLLKQAFETVKLVAEYAYKPLLGPLGWLMGGEAKASIGGASGSWGPPAGSASTQQTQKAVADFLKSAGTKTRKTAAGPNLYKEQMEDVAKLALSINELSTSEMTQIEILQQKLGAYTNLDPALKAYLQGVLTQTEAEEAQHERVTYAVQQTIKAYEEQQAALQAYEGDWRDYLGEMEDSLAALREENELYGLTATQIAEVSLRRAEETAEIARRNGVSQDYLYRLEREVDLRREILKETSGAEEKRAWRDIFDNIEKTAHDTFISIFDSGKSAFDRLRDTLKNGLLDLLYQMTIKKWIISISAAVTGSGAATALAGDVAGASGGGLGGLFSGGSSIFNAISQGNAGIISGIENLGAIIANGNGGIMDSIGGFIGSNSGAIAGALPFAPSIMSLLQGDVKGAVFSGAGAAIGSIFGGPVGGAIGSALGSFVGGLFGDDHVNPRGAIRTRLFEDGATKEVLRYSKDGGSLQPARDMNAQLVAAFKNTMDVLGVELARSIVFGGAYNTDRGSYFVYSDSDRAGAALANTGRVRQQDLGNAAAFIQIEALLGEKLLPAWINRVVEAMDRSVKTGEADLAFIIGIKQMHDALGTLPPEFAKLQLSFEQFITKNNIAQFQGILSATQTYFNLFYSEREKFDLGLQQLNKAYGALNLTLPESREAYRALVDSVDTGTEAGLGMYGALVALAPSMDAYYKALAEQKGAVDGLVDSLAELDINRFSTLVDYLRAQAYIKMGYSTAGIPGFASGGDFAGGLRVVGERGPEIEATGPARITSTADLLAAIANSRNNNAALVAEVRSLKDTVSRLLANIAQTNKKTADLLDDVTGGGGPMLTQVAA